MSKVKHIITKKVFNSTGAPDLGVVLRSIRGSYNEKGNPREMSRYGIGKHNYICSLIYNQKTEKLKEDPPYMYQYLVSQDRKINMDKLHSRLVEMVLECKKWMNKPNFFGYHELILYEAENDLLIIDNGSH
jgi:hypothetical protein